MISTESFLHFFDNAAVVPIQFLLVALGNFADRKHVVALSCFDSVFAFPFPVLPSSCFLLGLFSFENNLFDFGVFGCESRGLMRP